jgi:hypothetical protein
MHLTGGMSMRHCPKNFENRLIARIIVHGIVENALIARPHLLVWVISERRVPGLITTSGSHWLN